MPNKPIKASVKTKSITISQPHVITKKDVNSDSNGLSSTGIDNTAKTRMPQPRSNTKNDRVPYASKSSCNKKKKVELDVHPRNLLLSKNKKHMSSECNNIKLAIRNNKSEVVCAMFWKFLGTVHFRNDHVATILGYGDLQWGNILITKVYFVEGLRHNLFSVEQFCDSDLEAKAIATACYTQNHSIIHRRFGKTPYELINGRKSDISFLHVIEALFYPKNDRKGIGKLGTKVLQTPTTSTTIADTAPTPTNSSSQAPNIPNTSQDVDELKTQQQHVQEQDNQASLQPETVADNVPNAMLDGNTFVNPNDPPSKSDAESSSLQYVDPSNMHTFYQPYPHEYL
ncbi:hypothetical protein Tco_0886603 [Tanacetum coccineum]